jgi:hypothetical protein
MLDLSACRDWKTGAPLGGLARCHHCGWEGLPTYWRGEVLTECPKCEGFEDGNLDLSNVDPDAVICRIRQRVVLRPQAPKQGRNEPCACGSGKKFKKCCGR